MGGQGEDLGEQGEGVRSRPYGRNIDRGQQVYRPVSTLKAPSLAGKSGETELGEMALEV